MTTKVQAEFLAAGIISDQTQVSAASADHLLIFDATDNSLKKALVSTIASGATALDDIGTGDAASTLATSSGDIILDSPDSIVLDADGDGSVSFKDGGTRYALIEKSSDSMVIRSDLSDGDIIFQGKDNTSTITALTLDMSEAGKAIFTGDIANASGSMTIDVADNLSLDADGGNIALKDAGTQWGNFANNSSDFDIDAVIQDKDIKFNGNDGGSTITALRLDMSDAGRALFNGSVDIGGGLITRTGDLTLDVSGDIILDADGENIKFLDGGTERGQIDLGSANFTLRASTSDKDMIFRVNDGGTEITALTIDASEAGAATFNNNVTAFSDARLKNNIETIENGLDKIEQLRGVTYIRDEKESIGVIAQEVEKILPEIVLTADDEMGTKSVDYSRLTAVLIEAVKDLSARVKELEDK